VAKAGDKCPRCKEGLLERDALGLACNNCSYQKDNEELVRQEEESRATRAAAFRGKKFSIVIDDPEEGEHFLRGLIVARSNNSSPYFEEMIDSVNTILEPWRASRLAAEMAARG
jgi:uncharacterized Zn finger protein (UPF0148 family)